MSHSGDDGRIVPAKEVPLGSDDSDHGAGGWSADDARDYLEWSFRNDLLRFASCYGWDAVSQQIEAAKRGQV